MDVVSQSFANIEPATAPIPRKELSHLPCNVGELIEHFLLNNVQVEEVKEEPADVEWPYAMPVASFDSFYGIFAGIAVPYSSFVFFCDGTTFKFRYTPMNPMPVAIRTAEVLDEVAAAYKDHRRACGPTTTPEAASLTAVRCFDLGITRLAPTGNNVSLFRTTLPAAATRVLNSRKIGEDTLHYNATKDHQFVWAWKPVIESNKRRVQADPPAAETKVARLEVPNQVSRFDGRRQKN
jgi:hypothetical protein